MRLAVFHAKFSTAAAALVIAAGVAVAPPASSQPADLPIPVAKTDKYPPGVKVVRAPTGAVYTDSRGRVLYGMDLRTLLRWGPDPSQYCVGECVATWAPLLAPAGSKPNIAYPQPPRGAASGAPASPVASAPVTYTQQNAPDWTIIAGPQGPQWVYKGWHLVFTRRGGKAGSTAFDGVENRAWNTLKFIPPAPKLTTPNNVQALVVQGAYVLADADGRALFVGKCAAGCRAWRPFAAGMASGSVGDWAVSRTGDTPQWTYRGRPVFVSENDQAPPNADLLRP